NWLEEEAFAGRGASAPADQLPAVSVSSSPCWLSALSVYAPTALQFPADAHETETTKPPPVPAALDGRASAGRAPPTPRDQLPAVSVSSSPCSLPALSVYAPTALQFPADGQETDSMEPPLVAAALAGKAASTPAPHPALVTAFSEVLPGTAWRSGATAPDGLGRANPTSAYAAIADTTTRAPKPNRMVESSARPAPETRGPANPYRTLTRARTQGQSPGPASSHPRLPPNRQSCSSKKRTPSIGLSL